MSGLFTLFVLFLAPGPAQLHSFCEIRALQPRYSPVYVRSHDPAKALIGRYHGCPESWAQSLVQHVPVCPLQGGDLFADLPEYVSILNFAYSTLSIFACTIPPSRGAERIQTKFLLLLRLQLNSNLISQRHNIT